MYYQNRALSNIKQKVMEIRRNAVLLTANTSSVCLLFIIPVSVFLFLEIKSGQNKPNNLYSELVLPLWITQMTISKSAACSHVSPDLLPPLGGQNARSDSLERSFNRDINGRYIVLCADGEMFVNMWLLLSLSKRVRHYQRSMFLSAEARMITELITWLITINLC